MGKNGLVFLGAIFGRLGKNIQMIPLLHSININFKEFNVLR